MSAFTQAVILQVGINILLAFGYWIAVSTGKYSFGHAGFMAIGAYTASILTLNFSWPLPLALLAAGAAAAVAGGLVGWIALRLSLLYLAIITLVFSELINVIVSEWDYVGGASGLFGMSGTTVPMVVVCLVVVIAFLVVLTRSRLGLAYSAIREDEQAAMASGIRVTRVAASAFALSAAVTGVAGALSAHQTLIISPSLFGPEQSLIIILYCVLGGVQYFWGAAIGATVLSLLPIYFSSLADYYEILYGVLFVVLMIVRPQGLIGRTRFVDDLWGRIRRQPDAPTGERQAETVG